MKTRLALCMWCNQWATLLVEEGGGGGHWRTHMYRTLHCMGKLQLCKHFQIHNLATAFLIVTALPSKHHKVLTHLHTDMFPLPHKLFHKCNPLSHYLALSYMLDACSTSDPGVTWINLHSQSGWLIIILLCDSRKATGDQICSSLSTENLGFLHACFSNILFLFFISLWPQCVFYCFMWIR